MYRRTFSPFAFLALALPLAAQSPSRPLIFASSTHLVQINVIVDGSKGPVTGLTQDDFTLTADGHAQPIQVFSADDERTAPAALPAATAIATSATASSAGRSYSNTSQRGAGMVVVLLDAMDSPDGSWYCGSKPIWIQTGGFARAKQGALQYLQHLDPNLRVALYGLDSQFRVLADFTNDRAALIAAVNAYKPVTLNLHRAGAMGNLNAPAEAEAAKNYQREMTPSHAVEGLIPALHAISAHLAGLPGRISLVWVQDGPPVSGPAVVAALARDNVAVYTLDARGLLPRVARTGVGETAGVFPPNLGNICGKGVNGLNALVPGVDTMMDVADQTGGRALINTNDIGGAIAIAAADSVASYTLGFYLNPRSLDDRYHHLRVTVRGRDLQVLYPHGYWALRDTAASRDQAADLMDIALRSPLEASGLPLQGQVALAPPAASGALNLNAHLDISGIKFASRQGHREVDLEVETVLQDVAGNVLQRTRGTLHLAFTESEYQQHLRSGFAFDQAIRPDANAVTFRLIVQDHGSNAVGSLIIPLAGFRGQHPPTGRLPPRALWGSAPSLPLVAPLSMLRR